MATDTQTLPVDEYTVSHLRSWIDHSGPCAAEEADDLFERMLTAYTALDAADREDVDSRGWLRFSDEVMQ